MVYIGEDDCPGDSGYMISTEGIDNVYPTHEHDLLQAYWQIACKIAKEAKKKIE